MVSFLLLVVKIKSKLMKDIIYIWATFSYVFQNISQILFFDNNVYKKSVVYIYIYIYIYILNISDLYIYKLTSWMG